MSDRFPAMPAYWIQPDVSPSRPASAVDCGEGRPQRPPAWQERLGRHLLLFLSPRLRRGPQADPPNGLAPWERFEIARSRDPGRLSALWYPAPQARGAVLLVHPWLDLGQSFFYQRGRLRALRQAGYHAMTFDLGGVGGSGPLPAGFHDGDLADALAALRARAGGLPVHLWGVSVGGYWSHVLLSRTGGVAGAFFEDVPGHLIEWSKRMIPRGMLFYLFFQHCLGRTYRFLDARRHAPYLRVDAAAYVSGERDRGVLPGETRELALRAGAESLLVGGADHLQALRNAGRKVPALALRTFERATATFSSRSKK